MKWYFRGKRFYILGISREQQDFVKELKTLLNEEWKEFRRILVNSRGNKFFFQVDLSRSRFIRFINYNYCNRISFSIFILLQGNEIEVLLVTVSNLRLDD